MSKISSKKEFLQKDVIIEFLGVLDNFPYFFTFFLIYLNFLNFTNNFIFFNIF